MSRFTFCNCPAGFSAPPERHAPDCPGRSGAGKARTPVPEVIGMSAAPQPPALGGVPAGLDLQRIVTEALMDMIAAVTSTSPPANEPPPPFIQAGIDRAVSRISAHLVPLQAELTRMSAQFDELAAAVGFTKDRCEQAGDSPLDCANQLQAEIERLKETVEDSTQIILQQGDSVNQLKALLVLANAALEGRIDAALSKPAGSEQVSCNNEREHLGVSLNTPCKACGRGPCIDR